MARKSDERIELIQQDYQDPVRTNIDPEVNRLIDRETEQRVRLMVNATSEELTARIEALEQEWDIERVLEVTSSTLAFAGVVFSTRNRWWLLVPVIVLPFLFQYATQGWCPPLGFWRGMGVRTRKEIERERYALKVLRGDFGSSRAKDQKRADLALHAVGMNGHVQDEV